MNKYLIGGATLVAILALFLLASRTPSNADGLTPASRFDHAHGIALDAMDPSKLYIATHDGLYVLQNDKDLFRIGSSRDDLMGFTAHPTEASTFLSSGHPARGGNIGFQKSVDGGLTWTKVSPGLDGPVDFHSMSVSTVNPDTMYGSFAGKLQRSRDGGKNWEYAEGTIAPISLSTDPVRELVIYAATQSGVRVSEDAGDTWKSFSAQLEGGAVSVITFNPTDAKTALAFAESLGGLGKSTDGGKTWQRVSDNFGGNSVLYLAFSTREPDVAYALTSSNSIYKSTNRGEDWLVIR